MNETIAPVTHAPHAVHHTAAQLAQYCVNHGYTLHTHTGFSMTSILITSAAIAVSLLAGFGLGWYVKGRGLQGVKNDAANATQAVENVATAL